MAEIIAPEEWQLGIDDNDLLPSRISNQMFTGSGVKIANNASSCRVIDIMDTDYITTYDDRRINGLKGANAEGRDGWGASAYGVFQDVRTTSKTYSMSRHRSMALRVFDEDQYAGEIGEWGTATDSFISDASKKYIGKAALLSKARSRWEKKVLGVDMDKYHIFAIMNGHMNGRWVGDKIDGINYEDRAMDGDASHGKWVAVPGMFQGQAIPPSFAPIHCVDWDEQNIVTFLNNITVAWDNLYLPKDNRVIYLDPFYRIQLMQALIGSGIPATEAAYSDVREGNFTKLMGWEFNFDVPVSYWPKLWVDANYNVVHSKDASMPCDILQRLVQSAPPSLDEGHTLLYDLLESDRMMRTNYIRTDWDGTKFVKTITNYPLGAVALDNWSMDTSNLAASNLYVKAEPVLSGTAAATGLTNASYASAKVASGTHRTDEFSTGFNKYAGLTDVYPFPDFGAGRGVSRVPAEAEEATLMQTIGLVLYRGAGQLSQEYSSMVTSEGITRGKFTEMCYDVKYDAWAIEKYSAGIMPIVNSSKVEAKFGVPVREIVEETTSTEETTS